MDFNTLIHAAQRNEKSNKNEAVRYYSTKFTPPKKEQRSKELSENIKKFLARKEAEEKKQREEAQRKKEELLALRAMDKKATRRVNVMLKRTKSANKSVLEDAKGLSNTVTNNAELAQPDEDDYGYVSKEASDFYNKMMEKYSKMPTEKKFDLTKRKISTNLSSTKDRVKSALEREKEEAMHPHKRRKTSNNSNEREEDDEQQMVEEKPKPKSKPVPPPPSFHDLLKMAEKKQFEPIVIPVKPKEDEKLLTKKQKKEIEREREWRERREKEKNGKIPESQILKSSNKGPEPIKKPITNNGNNTIPMKKPTVPIPENKKLPEFKKPDVPPTKINGYNKALDNRIDREREREREKEKNRENTQRPNGHNISNNHPKLMNGNSIKPKMDQRIVDKNKNRLPMKNGQTSSANKPTPNNSSTKTIPPSTPPPPQPKKPIIEAPKYLDAFQKSTNSKQSKLTPNDSMRRDQSKMMKKKPMIGNKRRILDDDDEEYDSEMDDFIDDGPEEDQDYSRYISEIFGYDKSKYRHVDDDIDDMESSFAQQMREEAVSKKIAIMEDLEDMRMEEEEKRRKALMKKKMKR